MTNWRDVTAKNAKEGRVNKWKKENGQPLRKEKHWMTSQGREGEKVAHQNYNPTRTNPQSNNKTNRNHNGLMTAVCFQLKFASIVGWLETFSMLSSCNSGP